MDSKCPRYDREVVPDKHSRVVKSGFVKNPSAHFTFKILVNQDLEPMFGKSSLFP